MDNNCYVFLFSSFNVVMRRCVKRLKLKWMSWRTNVARTRRSDFTGSSRITWPSRISDDAASKPIPRSQYPLPLPLPPGECISSRCFSSAETHPPSTFLSSARTTFFFFIYFVDIHYIYNSKSYTLNWLLLARI